MSHKRKQSLVTRLLWLVVFGKEDLMHTLPERVTTDPPRRPTVPQCCVCGTEVGLRKDGWYGYRCSSADCICF